MKKLLRPVPLLAAAVLGLHLLALLHLPVPGRRAQATPVQAVQARSIEAVAPRLPAMEPVTQVLSASVAVREAAHPANPPRSTAAPALPAAPTAAAPQEPPAHVPEPQALTLAAAAPRPAAVATAYAADHLHVAPPQRLRYQIAASLRGVPVTAQGELQWRHDGGSYEARMEIKLPLLPPRLQHSAGRLTAAGLEPRRYAEKVRSEEAAHFERDKGRISFSSNRPQAALAAGAQDRLSLLLQLGAMVAGAPGRYRPGTEITVAVAGTREAEPWLFTVEGEEELALPGGTVKSLRIVRLARREFDQKMEIWLAPGMDYAPVRLRLTQPNGDWLDQQWSATDRS
jgi:hypothetical protein